MTAQPKNTLQSLHVCLAALGMLLLILNATMVNWAVEAHGEVVLNLFSRLYAALLVPDVAMVLMYLVLAVSRPRLSSQFNHSLCRVLFSLALAIGLLYHPSSFLDALVQKHKILDIIIGNNRSRYFSRTLEEEYFCDFGDVSVYRGSIEYDLMVCRVHVSSNVLSFFAAFMVVVELFLASRRGDIGEKKRKVDQEEAGEVYQL
ncbi:hypothetical protein CPB97_001022 [Podila verticillata]|nr:hypothetical protein CPB97_001022 [Podila verticillata]